MNPIYVAIDTGDLDRAQSLARAVAPHVGGLKLGLEFFMAQGPEGVRRMAAFGLPIFLDVKLHDIPNTVAGAMRSLSPLGLAIVNVHAAGGAAMMAAAREAMDPLTQVIAVTILTSLGEQDVRTIGFTGATVTNVERLACLAKESGLDGVVCSPAEAQAVKNIWPKSLRVVPGIRPALATLDDQMRTAAPQDALIAGATHLVIGRPITAAPDPAAAAEAIAASLA